MAGGRGYSACTRRCILTQAVKRSSVNLRPALRITKSRPIGLVASAYSYLGL